MTATEAKEIYLKSMIIALDQQEALDEVLELIKRTAEGDSNGGNYILPIDKIPPTFVVLLLRHWGYTVVNQDVKQKLFIYWG